MVVAFLTRRLILLNLLSSHLASLFLLPHSQYHDDFAIQIACVVNERLIDPSQTSPVQLLFLCGTCLIIRLHIALKLSLLVFSYVTAPCCLSLSTSTSVGWMSLRFSGP